MKERPKLRLIQGGLSKETKEVSSETPVQDPTPDKPRSKAQAKEPIPDKPRSKAQAKEPIPDKPRSKAQAKEPIPEAKKSKTKKFGCTHGECPCPELP